jgi:hypothetical protein
LHTNDWFLLESHFIYIAPHPIFSGFKGFDDWVSGGFEVLRGVLVLGIITATYMPAGKT